MRSRRSIRAASVLVDRAERRPGRRARTSVAVPPMPTSTVGPKRGSHVPPTISSTPFRRSAISSTEKAGGSSRSTSRAWRVVQRVGGRRRPTTTPPASDLWSRPSALSTYGGRNSPAASLQLVRRANLAGGDERHAGRGERSARRGVVDRRRPGRPWLGHRLDRCAARARQRSAASDGRRVLDRREHRDPVVGEDPAGRRVGEDRLHRHRLAAAGVRRRSAWRPRTRRGPGR